MQLFDNPALEQPDTITHQQDPLSLDLPDSTLIEVINKRIRDSLHAFEKLDYPNRRKKNREFLLGQQVDLKQLKAYESDYMDNLIYEAENTIKPIALSRLPDLLVKPGNDTEESKELADSMTDVINSDIRKRENRKVLGLAFKHVPVFFQGVIKCIWDPREGQDGDYRFINVHPDNLVVDHTASTNNPDDMDFIAEAREISIKEAIMTFPKKKEELMDQLISSGSFDKTREESSMASKIKIWEVWFTWYDSVRDPETGEQKWEQIEGVIWKYDQIILDKMKHPYWDWEGERRLFTLDPDQKREATEEDILASMLGETNLQSETIFRNYFNNPRKPYILLNYDQFGEGPLDATSRIEQSISQQKDVNRRGAQIREMNDRSKGKYVFNSKYIDKSTVESMDLNDPDQDVMVGGDVRMAMAYNAPPPAPAPLYTELESERQKVFSKMGTNATTRGVREGTETATARQLFKESDFGRIDDIVEDTINDAAEQMAQWAMQMVRLFYTQGHMRRLLGQDGDVSFQMITQDSVEDGQEVVVAASGVDKMQAKREAFERAGMQLTDPLTFFMDTDASDPKGRTEKLLTFMMSPELYMQKYVMDRDTQAMGEALLQQPVGQPQPGAEQMPPEQGMEQGMAMGGGGADNDPLGLFR